MIHFVGAGPGAADLITVRGLRLLGQADLVVFAGSLVSPELLRACKPGARTLDSKSMTLDEITDAMIESQRRGEECVRLQTGDVALFGALAEQTAALDAAGVAWEVVPGVSSLFAAAAALGRPYTAPGVSQTLVVTRAAGRTPTGEAERLARIARAGTTLAILLSATLVDEVGAELAEAGLDPATPAAIVVRATWPDEEVWRCTVGTLAACAREHGVRRQAIIVVGDVLERASAPSRLYDPTFTHGFRQATARRDAEGSDGADGSNGVFSDHGNHGGHGTDETDGTETGKGPLSCASV